MDQLVFERARTALYLVFTADALSMPVHWFYNPADIVRAFPGTQGVKRMEAAPASHPSSIMSLHSTRQGGRTAAGLAGAGAKEIVGDVILKGKRQFWGKSSTHYHHGLPAGENTLNAYCARLMLRYLGAEPSYQTKSWVQEYIRFMTAEVPQHPDTYAESYHRGFFANLMAGQPPDKCGQVTHDTPSVGAFVTVAPLAIVELLRQGKDKVPNVQRMARAHLSLTHPDESLFRICDEYVQLMSDLLWRSPQESPQGILKSIATKRVAEGRSVDLEALLTRAPRDDGSINSLQADLQVVGGTFSPACYISDSWPSLLYLATRYWDLPDRGLLANTNVGGENCHRGSVLGSLLGLCSVGPLTGEALGLTKQLRNYDAISKEIETVLSKVQAEKTRSDL